MFWYINKCLIYFNKIVWFTVNHSLGVARMVSSAEDPGSILGQEDLLETGLVTHSSLLVWRTPWTEGSGGLWSMGSQSQTWLSDFHYTPATLGEMLCQTLGWPAGGGLQTAFHACRTGTASAEPEDAWSFTAACWEDGLGSASPPVAWRGGFLLLLRSVSTSLCLLFMFRNVDNFRLNTESHSLPWSRIQCMLVVYKLWVTCSESPTFETLLLILYYTESLSGHRWRCCTFKKSSFSCLWKI